MRFTLKSITGKIFFLYMSLSLINIAFFSVIIYENQIDLIAENTILNYREMMNKLAEQIQFSAVNRMNTGIRIDSDEFIDAVNVIEKHVSSYMIITTSGDILLNRGYASVLTEKDMANSIRAVTGRNFAGAQYFSDTDNDKNRISFYLPLFPGRNGESVVIFSRNLLTINEKMKDLYKEIAGIIALLAVFHIIVAFLFYRIFVKPLSFLHGQSRKIASGEYSVRTEMRRGDEIGELAEAFDTMAEAIQDKIEKLEEYNLKMEYELTLAGDVQKSIFPQLADDGKFAYSLFSRPYGKVSGDFYDAFSFDDGSRAYIIADVSGHGVPAALMTMTLKEKFEMSAYKLRDPASMFCMLNEKVWSMFRIDGVMPRFFSGFYMLIDSSYLMSYCNAGHPHPLLISRDGTIKKLETEGGVVGIFNDMGDYYKTERVLLERGDKIILLTDGIVEAMNSDNAQYGWGRIIDSVNGSGSWSIGETVQRMVDSLSVFTAMERFHDDATILGIEIL